MLYPLFFACNLLKRSRSLHNSQHILVPNHTYCVPHVQSTSESTPEVKICIQQPAHSSALRTPMLLLLCNLYQDLPPRTSLCEGSLPSGDSDDEDEDEEEEAMPKPKRKPTSRRMPVPYLPSFTCSLPSISRCLYNIF